MADSESILNLLLAATGAGVKAYGASNAASAQKQSMQYQASVADNNAILAQDRYSIALDNGQQQDQQLGLKVAQTFGMQRANLAANGVDLGQGGANDILTSTKMMGQIDLDQIQTNAERQAWGYQVQGAEDTSNANALRAAASTVNPTNAALTSLVGSAPAVSSAWKTYSKPEGA